MTLLRVLCVAAGVADGDEHVSRLLAAGGRARVGRVVSGGRRSLARRRPRAPRLDRAYTALHRPPPDGAADARRQRHRASHPIQVRYDRRYLRMCFIIVHATTFTYLFFVYLFIVYLVFSNQFDVSATVTESSCRCRN